MTVCGGKTLKHEPQAFLCTLVIPIPDLPLFILLYNPKNLVSIFFSKSDLFRCRFLYSSSDSFNALFKSLSDWLNFFIVSSIFFEFSSIFLIIVSLDSLNSLKEFWVFDSNDLEWSISVKRASYSLLVVTK